MKIQRKSIIVYYNNHENFLNSLKQLDVNIVFISKSFEYLVLYYDHYKEKEILSRLVKIKGYLSHEESCILNKEATTFNEN